MSRHNVIGMTAAAMLICYAGTLRTMSSLWWNDQDLGHCFAALPAALWVIWRDRERWLRISAAPNWWGFPVLALGAAMHTAAVMGVGTFTESVALLVSIVGVVLAIGGFPILRAWAFPLALLIFMLPKLVSVYNQVTLPLQLVATRVAAGMLGVLGAAPVREGNLLSVSGHVVAVAEACNGLRYLLSLGFIAAIFGYIAGAGRWVRVALLAASAPLAIFGNALRVAMAAYFPALDAGAPHEAAGAGIFALCVLGLISLRWMIPGRRHV